MTINKPFALLVSAFLWGATLPSTQVNAQRRTASPAKTKTVTKRPTPKPAAKPRPAPKPAPRPKPTPQPRRTTPTPSPSPSPSYSAPSRNSYSSESSSGSSSSGSYSEPSKTSYSSNNSSSNDSYTSSDNSRSSYSSYTPLPEIPATSSAIKHPNSGNGITTVNSRGTNINKLPITTVNTSAPEYIEEAALVSLENVNLSLIESTSGHGRNIIPNIITLATGKEVPPAKDVARPQTPIQILEKLPAKERQNLCVIAQQQLARPEVLENPECQQFWQNFNQLVTRPDADICLGKSYGDPHMRTYDGYHYDLQSVGEFVLTKAVNSDFEIQSRQTRSSASFSLNTAVAMNVNGDRVSIYTQDFPDGYTNLPIRVNGDPIKIKGSTYTLARGGIIRLDGKTIHVDWPTGEQVMIQFFKSRSAEYMNIIPKVYGAMNSGGYVGLLGNADGNPNNDLVMNNGENLTPLGAFYSMSELTGNKRVARSIRTQEKEYAGKLAHDFADSWRVSYSASLFNYRRGRTTRNFTDHNFPKKITTLATIKKSALNSAKQECEAVGLTGEELKACITDVALSGDSDFATQTARIENDNTILQEFKATNSLQKNQPLHNDLNLESTDK